MIFVGENVCVKEGALENRLFSGSRTPRESVTPDPDA
jgi:hypothetical protein